MGTEKQINDLHRSLSEYYEGEQLRGVAEVVINLGYKREKNGIWKHDESHGGKYRDVFVCSSCGHWQSSQKRTNNVFYMHYCPFCGAKMSPDEAIKKI